MSDYQKYLKYKKKYLNAKKIYGGGDCITERESRSFMEFVNKTHEPEIIPVPRSMNDDPLPAYLGIPDFGEEVPTTKRRSSRNPKKSEYENIKKLLIDDNILNLTLQVTDKCDKHSILLYFDQENNEIELWDSNGYCLGDNTWAYLETLLNYLKKNLEAEPIVSNETHHNINHFGGGHCDALSLFYAVLRQEGYERAQDIYTIDWTNSANIKNLNTYIKEKKIVELKNFEDNGLFS